MAREPDFKFKFDTEGPTASKQQRLAHLRGSAPSSTKPTPAAPGEEAEERTMATDGSARLADEVGGAKKWDVEAITPRPPPVQEPPETLAHIISDTFKHPGRRGLESLAHLSFLATHGRTATAEELAPIRNYLGPVLDGGLKVAFPELMGPYAAGTGIDIGERASNGENITTATLVKEMSPFDAPREGLKPEPASASPSSALLPAKGAAPTPLPKTPATESFKPPTRLEDGRIGYPLSPTRPPRLPEEATLDIRDQPGPSTRADAAAAPQTAQPASEPTLLRADQVPLNLRLRTSRYPETGKIQYKEFGWKETYRNTAAAGEEPKYKLEIDIDGYSSNYRGKNLESIGLHGTQSRQEDEPLLMYRRGREVFVQKPEDGSFKQVRKFAFEREVTGSDLVDYIRQDHGIDLVSPARGGTGSSEPLYLLTCRAAKGCGSTAQQVSDATGREVRAHSRYPVLVYNPSHTHGPDQFIQPTPGKNPFLPLIKLRNMLRPNSKGPGQLVHKKFHPNPNAAARAQAARRESGRAPIIFQQFPRPTISTFTPTQPSSATSPMASFTPSQAPESVSFPTTSLAPTPSPQPTASGSLGSAFFDHVPPPPPPTHPLVRLSVPLPQHATLSSGPSPVPSSQLASGAPSSESLSDFYSSPLRPPTHPLAIQPAPLPQHAMMLSDIASAPAPRPPSQEIAETWV